MNISGAVEHGNNSLVAGRLYDAALSGSVESLNRLLQQHGNGVLSRFSLTSFAETPLHLAALKGHLEFSVRLLELNWELASELDAEKCTPLHLAAANGHHQVVRVLLKAHEKACLFRDQEGRVPLHLAAMRGRVSVVRELLNSKLAKESSKLKVGDGHGILHLCVKYNHLDVLEVLLASVGDDGVVLNMTDSRGNTVLHLAVLLQQIETVRFLLGLPRARAEMINTVNEMGLTPLGVLNNLSLLDYKSLQIREVLVLSYGMEAMEPSYRHTGAGPRRGDVGAIEGACVNTHLQEEEVQAPRTCGTWIWKQVKRLVDYRGDWMDEKKGSIMMVSGIIATVTFAAAISPPGGVWQQDSDKSLKKYGCTADSICFAGEAVLGDYYPEEFINFMKFNMISFVSSLATVFLLVSGFPLNNKFTLWILSLAMCVTISFLGLTFLEVMWLVIPGHILDKYRNFKRVSFVVWMVMIGLVGCCLLIRLSYWLTRQCNSSRVAKLPRKLLPRNPNAYREMQRFNESKC